VIFAAVCSNFHRISGGGLQIIGLSATIPNVQLLADRAQKHVTCPFHFHGFDALSLSQDWLDAQLYICHDRPIPLTMSVAPKQAMTMQTDHFASTM